MTPRIMFSAAAAALLLTAASAHAAAIDMTSLNVNGSASAINSNDVNLTPGVADDVGTAFIASSYSSASSFSGSFVIRLVDLGAIDTYGNQADGVSFMFQNAAGGADALGGGGPDHGTGGLSNVFGLAFASWDNDHATIFTSSDTCTIFTNDFTGAQCGNQPRGNFVLGPNSSNIISVSFNYSAGLFSYSASNAFTRPDTTTGTNLISDSRAFDLTTLGSDVYVGFGGGTGLSWAVQDVTDFNLDVGAPLAPAPEPATWAMMLMGLGAVGASLRSARRRVTAAA